MQTNSKKKMDSKMKDLLYKIGQYVMGEVNIK